MKRDLLRLGKIYLALLLVFAVQKPLFMLYHFDLYKEVPFWQWWKEIYYGMPLDYSMSAYLCVIPVLLTLVSVWIKGAWFAKSVKGYFRVINLFISVIFISDLELYTYWGFRLDSTPLFYLASPAEAMASVPVTMMFVLPLLMVITWLLLNLFMKKVLDDKQLTRIDFFRRELYGVRSEHRIRDTFGLILLLGLLFIPIRGGFTVSTMNVGKVYHSSNMLLNHASINPMFSLFSSMAKGKDFASQYRFMENEQAENLFATLCDQPVAGVPVHAAPDSTVSLFKTSRPNVVLVVLESFSGIITEALGGIPDVAPNLNTLYKEGVAFTNFYANSFRTDRGLVSVLSAYPAQPTNSIMKYPSKSQSLPSISKSLKAEGYDLEFLYGGDADFTNMRSYFVGAGFEKLISDTDFPLSERLSKWGVRDDKTFQYLTQSILNQTEFPFMKMFLTLSSHEPFDVPTCKFDDPYLNSVAYTDSCLGVFIDEMKRSPVWDNTVFIFLPDHCMRYPYNIDNHDPKRYHIPMVWAGGAVKEAVEIDRFGSQIDLAATLLNQMGIAHDEFTFSKDLLKPDNKQFAFYTFKDGFGILNDSASFVYDCESDREIVRSEKAVPRMETEGKAFLQTLYNDLSKR
ncbi:MAG: sulfatase-like hydrolase/transferase [Bacteroidales bacterium]